jgi:hypothetical protein
MRASCCRNYSGLQYGLPFSSYATTYPLRQVNVSSALAEEGGAFFDAGGAVGPWEQAPMTNAATLNNSSFFTTTSAETLSHSGMRPV